MLIHVKLGADSEKLAQIINNANEGDTLNVQSNEQFEHLKSLIIDQKRVGLRIALIDEDGFIVKQIATQKRIKNSQSDTTQPSKQTSTAFSARQLAVISALERVMKHLEQEGVSLVGYSDELVAVPTNAKASHASDVSIDIDTSGTYSGSSKV